MSNRTALIVALWTVVPMLGQLISQDVLMPHAIGVVAGIRLPLRSDQHNAEAKIGYGFGGRYHQPTPLERIAVAVAIDYYRFERTRHNAVVQDAAADLVELSAGASYAWSSTRLVPYSCARVGAFWFANTRDGANVDSLSNVGAFITPSIGLLAGVSDRISVDASLCAEVPFTATITAAYGLNVALLYRF